MNFFIIQSSFNYRSQSTVGCWWALWYLSRLKAENLKTYRAIDPSSSKWWNVSRNGNRSQKFSFQELIIFNMSRRDLKFFHILCEKFSAQEQCRGNFDRRRQFPQCVQYFASWYSNSSGTKHRKLKKVSIKVVIIFVCLFFSALCEIVDGTLLSYITLRRELVKFSTRNNYQSKVIERSEQKKGRNLYQLAISWT